MFLAYNAQDGQHEILQLVRGDVALFTIKEPTSSLRVLDLGCGTGIWCQDFALKHPSAEVFGCDIHELSEKQVVGEARNFVFYCQNIENGWQFEAANRPFDYIHARLLIAGVRDWTSVCQSVFQHLRPGGIFESFEGLSQLHAKDSKGDSDSPAIVWFSQLRDFMNEVGLDPYAPLSFPSQLRKTGFEVLEDHEIEMHLDPYQSSTGKLSHRQRIASFQMGNWIWLVTGMTPAMASKSNNPEALWQLAKQAKEDLLQNGVRKGYSVKL